MRNTCDKRATVKFGYFLECTFSPTSIYLVVEYLSFSNVSRRIDSFLLGQREKKSLYDP